NDTGMIPPLDDYTTVSAQTVVNLHAALRIVQGGHFSVRPLGNRATTFGSYGSVAPGELAAVGRVSSRSRVRRWTRVSSRTGCGVACCGSRGMCGGRGG